ncbi:MAG: TRAP transporter substrate-binding protein [Planctomycetales bacterium]|nr:TRAP transporter substrate-binding protein [Planctomycetales bacterium]
MRQIIVVICLTLLTGIGYFLSRHQRTISAEARQLEGMQQTIVLRGASQFDEPHAFTRALRKFEELVKTYYHGRVEFELYKNSELGLEKEYFTFMSQGVSVDYAIVSPAHMSTFSSSAPLIDMPFLFRDLEHWEHVLTSDALQPIVDEIAAKADVHLIGYAGGGTRNLIVNRPVYDLQTLKGLTIRVMGAPIQSRMFQAIGTAPAVIAYDEIYNAIQTGVIEAAENEAAGLQQMKFYEVGQEISRTEHAITVRPICFSGKTMRTLPVELRQAIIRAGREAGAYGRGLESSEDQQILERLQEAGQIHLHDFRDRDQLLELAAPVKDAYAKEIGAERLLQRIDAVQ